MPSSLFTIGHSNQDVPSLLKMLAANSVQVVVDVRSAPYSRYASQFNKPEIEAAISASGLRYLYMGDVLGGKPTAPEYLDAKGKVVYERLAASEGFQNGLARLQNGVLAGWTICLLCAEEDPLQCHRHLLIAKELEDKRHISVWHLRGDGSRLRAREQLRAENGQLRLF